MMNTAENNDNEKLETFAKYVLEWFTFDDSRNEEQPHNVIKQHYKSYKAPEQMFPCVEELITIGSRAEKTNLDSNSDLDRLYVIGPGVVVEKVEQTFLSWFFQPFLFLFYLFISVFTKLFLTRKTEPKFFCLKTENIGYYTIQDEKENTIYPSDIHVKLGGGLSVLTQGQPKAALPGDKIEDKVPAMRLKEWPKDILDGMENKLKWCKKIKEDLKEIPLYMAWKCHPLSSTQAVEWRLIFPLVEKEALLALPSIQRRAYMICKRLNKRIKWRKYTHSPILPFSSKAPHKEVSEPIRTFHWKTALLWKMDEYDDDVIKCEDGREVYYRVKDLVKYLYNSYKTRELKNYFVPEMNLLTKFKENELNNAEIELKNMLDDFPIMIIESIKAGMIHVDNISVQESNDMPALALLDAYLSFLEGVFQLASYNQTFFKTLPMLRLPSPLEEKTICWRTELRYRPLAIVTKYFPQISSVPIPTDMQEDIQFLLNIQTEFTILVVLLSLEEDYSYDDKYLKKCISYLCKEVDNESNQFYVGEGWLYRIYRFLHSSSHVTLKASVVKYLDESTGEIKIDNLLTDIKEYCPQNDVMRWCDAIVDYLKSCDFGEFQPGYYRNFRYRNDFTADSDCIYLPLKEVLVTPISMYLTKLENMVTEKNRNLRKNFEHPEYQNVMESVQQWIKAATNLQD